MKKTGCCRKRGSLRRCTAFLLAALLGVASPMQAVASVKATSQNATGKNQQILKTLQSITGNEKNAREIYRQLKALDLFDESGNLVTENLLVDGEEKTVWEVLEMIETMDDADLDKTATVAGMEISFRDLKTMAEIETELMRIQSVYFNKDIKLTDDQNDALDSLYEQLGTEGISIEGFADTDGEIQSASGIDRENVLSVAAQAYSASGTVTATGSGDKITVPNEAGTIVLNVSLKEAADYPVYFQVRTLDGSAKSKTNYNQKPQVGFPFLDTREGAETGDNLVSCMIPAGETTVSVTIDLKKEANENRKKESWNGDRIFFVELSGPENTSFDGGEMFRLYKVCIAGNAELNMPEDAKWHGKYKTITHLGDYVDLITGLMFSYHGLEKIADSTKVWLTENRSSGDLFLKKSVSITGESLARGWGEAEIVNSIPNKTFKDVQLWGMPVEVTAGNRELYPESAYMGYIWNPEEHKPDTEKAWWNEVSRNYHQNTTGDVLIEFGTPYKAAYFCDPDWPYPEDEIVYRSPDTPVSHSLNMAEIDPKVWETLLKEGLKVKVEQTRIYQDPVDFSFTRDSDVAYADIEILTHAPRLVSARAQSGHYQAGSRIPIILEFSHPVTVKEAPKTTGKLEMAEAEGTSSRYLTVLADCSSQVFSDPDLNQLISLDTLMEFLKTGIYVDSWTGENTVPEKNTGLTKIEDTGVNLVQDLESALNANQLSINFPESSVISPDKDSVKLQIPLSDPVYRLLADTGKGDEAGNIYTTRLAVSADGKEFQFLYFADVNGNYTKGEAALLVGTVPLPVNASDADVQGAVELYLMKGEATDWSTERVAVKPYGVYTRQAAIFMRGEHMEILYPQGFPEDTGKDTDEIFLDTENIQQLLKLDWTRKADSPADLTWPEDVSWAPADEESGKVASIDASGQITLTGTAGQAKFVLTAENAEFTPREGEEAGLYQVVSKPIRAGVGNTPFLLIPKTSETVSVQEGQSALVMWQTNLFDKNGIANSDRDFKTNVTVILYRAVYDEDTNQLLLEESLQPENRVGAPVILTGTQNDPVNQYSFTGLEKLQEKGRHSYVFMVEMQADKAVPGDWHEKPMQAVGYIDVTARPASIAVSRPEGGLYQTDETGSMTLTWNTADVDGVEGAEAYLAVTDNEDGEKMFEQKGITLKTDDEDSITFPLKVKNGFRTTYTVEAKIKNKHDTGWSTDSYQLNLYDTDSLELLVNGQETVDGETITISNRDRIADMNQKEILDLERKIFLQSGLSINYEEYSWQDLEDRMRWNAETKEGQGDVAEIQTMYGSRYHDIRGLNFETYSPSQEQLLVGVSDGTAQVSAEHHFTSDLKAGVDVKIETLKDRLYLFQFYPMQKTSITYVKESGEQVTVESNDKGEAAIYEPEGIHQDIYVRSGSGKNLYMGTVYKESLVTSEKDAGSLELYPLNILKLKKASSVPLAFKTPDGRPYTGEITVRGGVLLNGQYQPEITIDHENGAKDITIDLGTDGSHVFHFDMTQYPEEYTEKAIQFVFEIQFEDDAYEPVYLELDGTLNTEAVVRMAENIVNLRAYNAEDGLQPVTVHKRIYFSDKLEGGYRNVLNTTGRVGPGTNHPVVTLETIAAWWGNERGESDTARKLVYLDQYGKELPSQRSELVDYPFLSMPIVRNMLILDEEAMNAMELDTGESQPMELAYRNSDEKLLRQETSKLRIINMIGVEDVTSSERLSIILHEMTAASANSPEVKFSNSMAGVGLELATKVGIDTDFLQLQLLPTADPTRFQGFVTIGLNNMNGDNVVGLDPQYDKEGDLDYMPGFSEITSLLNRGIKDTVQEEKVLVNYAASMIKDQGKRGVAQGGAANGTLKDGKIYYAMKGYFETEVFYDYEEQKWEMAVLNGGFTVGGGYGRDWKWNASVGPVPVLAELGLGAGLTVNFQAAADRQEMVNEYFTQMRLMVYLRAFSGIGFDYAIVALKLGLYGQINMDARINFLNSRDAVSDPKVGLYLAGSGEFGILFAVKFLFITYEKILVGVSGEIGHANNDRYDENLRYWDVVKDGKSG